MYTFIHKNISLTALLLLFCLPFFGQEICDNEIDDDGDGYIDYFDSDCDCFTANRTNYYYRCSQNQNPCQFVPQPQIGIQTKWHAVIENYGGRVVPLSGDINSDGIVEVVINGTNHLTIFNANDGSQIQTIPLPNRFMDFSAPAMADVDRDGFAEIFVGVADFVIQCYKNTGTGYALQWADTLQESNRNPSIIDFDNDGIPELLCGNVIIDPITGQTIIDGGTANSSGQGRASGAWSVGADVIPDLNCTYCTGKELIAGNQVYSVNIDRGNNFIGASLTIHMQIAEGDGRTSIADLDKDGDLDAVITRGNEIYIWDLQTPTLLAPKITGGGAPFSSHVNIGDFNKDGLIDMGVVGNNLYTVLTFDNGLLDTLWQIATTDGSGMTGSTLFDFDADGSQEVVYRDETDLRIIDGATGVDKVTIPCTSGTRNEYPTVADIDQDGESEIMCACGNGITVFETDGSSTWAPSRKVWNQHAYFNVNINDDLTVPLEQQNHGIIEDSIKMNTFLTQYSAPIFILPNATITAIDTTCLNDSITLTFSICNDQSVLSDSLPVSLFLGDPRGAPSSPIQTKYTTGELIDSSCEQLFFSIHQDDITDTLFIIGNVDTGTIIIPDFSNIPPAKNAECSYENNVIRYYQEYTYTIQTKDVSCFGGNDGEINITSTRDYLYSLDGGPGYPVGDFTGLMADSFDIRITNPAGCFKDTSAIILEPDTLESTFTQTDISCFGFNDGVIDVTTTGGTTPYDYSLDYGITNQSSPVFLNLIAGTYNIQVTDSNGCINLLNTTLTEPPKFSISLPADTCIRDQLAIGPELENGISPFTYNWYDDFYINSVSNDSNFITNRSTDVLYRLVVSDSSNCLDTAEIQVNVIPQANFTVDTNQQCEPASFLFTNTSTYQNPLSCIWDFGDGITINNCNSEIAKDYDSVGVYTVELTIIENNGCADTITRTDTVASKIKPVAYFNYFPKDLISTVENKIYFDNESVDANSYAWTVDGESVAITRDLTYEFVDNPTHTYEVCLYVDTASCYDIHCETITLTPDVIIYLPNTFSPNGDGINDIFRAEVNGRENLILEDFIIKNRWGQTVFQTNNIDKGWNGGDNPIIDTYVWRIKYKVDETTESVYINGIVNLIK